MSATGCHPAGRVSLASPSPLTLRTLFVERYRPERLPERGRKSMESWESFFSILAQHYGRELAVQELSDELAAEHFQWLLDRGTGAVRINTGHRSPLFALWRFAYQKRLIDRLPTLAKLRENREAPDAWSHRELAALVEAAGTAPLQPLAKLRHDVNQYMKALLLVGYWTGLRLRSLLSIERDAVQLESGWLLVSARGIKTRRGKRFRMGADAVEAVRAIWQPRRQLLFEYPYQGYKPLLERFHAITAAAGLPASRHPMPCFHKLRRTVATLVTVRHGVAAAAQLLGHSTTEITRRYLDPSKLSDADATALLPAMFPRKRKRKRQHPAPLARARHLLKAGDFVAAGWAARAGLDQALSRRLRAASSGRLAPPRKLQDKLRAVLRAGLASQTECRAVARLVKIANRAAHGLPIDAEQAGRVIAGIERFLSGLGRS